MVENPYKVLGVSPGASKEEIKDAYNILVKKYHPDRYPEEHMKELAEQKMKEVNEAYDMIINGHSSAYSGYSGTHQSQNGRNDNPDAEEWQKLNQARRFISEKNFNSAREILQSMNIQSGEWLYLMGIVEINTGNFEKGKYYIGRAVELDPSNTEYRAAYNQIFQGTVFSRQPGYYRRSEADSCCQMCVGLWCLDTCCECGGGDLIGCC